jgi:beta-1,4-mannosyltransferase
VRTRITRATSRPVVVERAALPAHDAAVPGRHSGYRPAVPLPPIRVASVPADHPYVRHIGAPTGDLVERLPDEREPGQRGWWPPRMLETEWVERHAEDFDLFHVQFGFDGRHPEQLRELVALLDELGKPLVYTVHDLRNPNHEDQGLHDGQLEVLVGAADALVTLTDRAAERIEERFGRRAEVIPHSHVVPLDLLGDRYGSPHAAADPPLVGVHLKSMRANMVGVPLLEALTADEGIGGARLRVDVHTEIWQPQAPAFRGDLRTTLEHLVRRGALDLSLHEYFSDLELYDYLAGLDVAILPYRFGTHSGWLEACRDLGTAVVAPSCGCYADQGPVFTYECDEGGLDGASLREAVRRALGSVDAEAVRPLGVAARLEQRTKIAGAHERLYRSLLGHDEAAPRPAAFA